MGKRYFVDDDSERSTVLRTIVRGAVAGGLGGLAGAAVKQLCEAIVPPRTSDREPPPGVLAAKLTHRLSGRDLCAERKESVSLGVHWLFSTAIGALYGAIGARFPQTRFGRGISFGVTVWAGFHEITLPLLRATPALWKLPAQEQVNELLTHALYGLTVESVRARVMQE